LGLGAYALHKGFHHRSSSSSSSSSSSEEEWRRDVSNWIDILMIMNVVVVNGRKESEKLQMSDYS
jgi:hypothetical protein